MSANPIDKSDLLDALERLDDNIRALRTLSSLCIGHENDDRIIGQFPYLLDPIVDAEQAIYELFNGVFYNPEVKVTISRN